MRIFFRILGLKVDKKSKRHYTTMERIAGCLSQSQTEINAPRESRTRSHVHSTLTQSELNNMNEKERQFCEKTGIVFL